MYIIYVQTKTDLFAMCTCKGTYTCVYVCVYIYVCRLYRYMLDTYPYAGNWYNIQHIGAVLEPLTANSGPADLLTRQHRVQAPKYGGFRSKVPHLSCCFGDLLPSYLGTWTLRVTCPDSFAESSRGLLATALALGALMA